MKKIFAVLLLAVGACGQTTSLTPTFTYISSSIDLNPTPTPTPSKYLDSTFEFKETVPNSCVEIVSEVQMWCKDTPRDLARNRTFLKTLEGNRTALMVYSSPHTRFAVPVKNPYTDHPTIVMESWQCRYLPKKKDWACWKHSKGTTKEPK